MTADGTRAVKRQSIPDVAWMAAGLWCGTLVSEAVWWTCRLPEAPVPLLRILAAASMVSPVLRGSQPGARAAAWFAAAGLLAGSLLSSAACQCWAEDAARLADAGARAWTGVVIADAAEGRFGPRVVARVEGGPYDGLVMLLMLEEGAARPELGQRIAFRAIPKEWKDAAVARRMYREGVHGRAAPWELSAAGWRRGPLGALLRWRARNATALAACGDDASLLMRGIVLGDRRDLRGSRVESDFRAVGLSHALAVSGTHLSIVCAGLLFVTGRLRLRRRVVESILVVCAWTFVAATGFAVSAVRAGAMLAVIVASRMLTLRNDGLAALSCAVVGVLVTRSDAAFDVGFALSVCSVASLLVFGRLAGSWLSAAVPWAPVSWTAAFATSVVAQIATIPIAAAAFGIVSPIGPVANLVALPAIELALGSTLVGCIAADVRPVAHVALWLGHRSAALAAWIAGMLARIPGACVCVSGSDTTLLIVATIAVLAWHKWPQPRSEIARRTLFAAGSAVLLAAAVSRPAPGLRLTVLDVGQGDAILVQSRWRSVLVDAGPDAAALRKALGRHGVRELDGVVLTHAHDDHTGGLEGLAGTVRLEWVGVPEADVRWNEEQERALARICEDGAYVVRLRQGQRIGLGEAQLEVLWPKGHASGASANNTSVVLQVRWGSFDAVLTGDAEVEAQSALDAQGLAREVEVLKVAHHGSANGLDPGTLQKWSPVAAVISVGAENPFGHPSGEVLSMLARAGARVYRTDEAGDVVIEADRWGWRVRTQRRPVRQSSLELESAAPAARRYVTIRLYGGSEREVRHACHWHRRTETRLSHTRGGRVPAVQRPPPA